METVRPVNRSKPARPLRAVSGSVEDEGALIERARTDPEAFGELYVAHYASVAAHVWSRTRDAHATEDIVGSVFEIALRRLPSYRSGRAPFRLYLLRIASNAVNGWVRKNLRGASALARLAERSATEATPDEDTETLEVRAALASLPLQLQTVLSLYYLDELTVSETARVLRCREGTVKSRLSRARRALERRLLRRSQRDEGPWNRR